MSVPDIVVRKPSCTLPGTSGSVWQGGCRGTCSPEYTGCGWGLVCAVASSLCCARRLGKSEGKHCGSFIGGRCQAPTVAVSLLRTEWSCGTSTPKVQPTLRGQQKEKGLQRRIGLVTDHEGRQPTGREGGTQLAPEPAKRVPTGCFLRLRDL